MHFSKRSIRNAVSQAVSQDRLSQGRLHSAGQLILAVVLVLGLSLAGLGCDSGGSNEDTSVDDEPTAPAAPSGLTATSGNAEVGLEWNAVSEANSYNVYRSTSSTSGASGDPMESGVSSESYTDDSAQNGTTYYYRVTAVSSDGLESDASGEEEVTPFDEPPSRP